MGVGRSRFIRVGGVTTARYPLRHSSRLDGIGSWVTNALAISQTGAIKWRTCDYIDRCGWDAQPHGWVSVGRAT